MITRNLLAGTALALLLATPAFAGPTLSLPTGPLYAGFNGVESFAGSVNGCANTSGVCYGATNGSENPALATSGLNESVWGVFVLKYLDVGSVTIPNQAIADSLPQVIPAGEQIVGIEYGINLLTVGNPTNAQGGVIDLYLTSGTSITQTTLEGSNPTADRTAQNQYTGVTCASGNTATCTFLAQIDLVPGAYSPLGVVDPGVTVSAATNPANVDNTTAQFFGEVDGSATNGSGQLGLLASTLAGQWFDFNGSHLLLPDIADIYAKDSTQNCSIASAATCSKWANASAVGLALSDPVEAFAVPEPASLALLGSGLLGIGWLGRRRQKGKTSAAA